VYQDKNVVLLEIPRASDRPVQFEGREFIRIGSYKKSLKDFPDQERTLWRLFDNTPFEYQLAVEHVSSEEVLALLDYSHAFEMLGIPLPESRIAIKLRNNWRNFAILA
jgi:predicted HTH transcriptional regulator